MTTREEWLRHMDDALQGARNLSHGRVYNYRTNPVLPSFPGRSTRSVLLGDIAIQESDQSHVLLVSPLISSSLEVAIVLYWLRVRQAYGFTDAQRLNSARAGRTMEWAGFNAPYRQCVPTEELIDRIAPVVESVVNTHEEYPSQDVALARRATQTTRLLKVVCPLPHAGDYLLRMSQKQYDRGAPQCGICGQRMTVEV